MHSEQYLESRTVLIQRVVELYRTENQGAESMEDEVKSMTDTDLLDALSGIELDQSQQEAYARLCAFRTSRKQHYYALASRV